MNYASRPAISTVASGRRRRRRRRKIDEGKERKGRETKRKERGDIKCL